MSSKVAVLLADDFEDSELEVPVDRLKQAGHETEILGREAQRTLTGKRGESQVITEAAISDRDPSGYDAVLIPGGYSPDRLRVDGTAADFVRRAFAAGKPIAAICHGPQLLIEADVVGEHKVTSFPSVRTDLVNAGAHWVDEEVVVDEPLITSRKPADLEAFSHALLERLT